MKIKPLIMMLSFSMLIGIFISVSARADKEGATKISNLQPIEEKPSPITSEKAKEIVLLHLKNKFKKTFVVYKVEYRNERSSYLFYVYPKDNPLLKFKTAFVTRLAISDTYARCRAQEEVSQKIKEPIDSICDKNTYSVEITADPNSKTSINILNSTLTLSEMLKQYPGEICPTVTICFARNQNKNDRALIAKKIYAVYRLLENKKFGWIYLDINFYSPDLYSEMIKDKSNFRASYQDSWTSSFTVSTSDMKKITSWEKLESLIDKKLKGDVSVGGGVTYDFGPPAPTLFSPVSLISKLASKMTSIGEMGEDSYNSEINFTKGIFKRIVHEKRYNKLLVEKNEAGQTPLICASELGLASIVKTLLENKNVIGHINDKDKHGFTAWDYSNLALMKFMFVLNPQIAETYLRGKYFFTLRYYLKKNNGSYLTTRKYLEKRDALKNLGFLKNYINKSPYCAEYVKKQIDDSPDALVTINKLVRDKKYGVLAVLKRQSMETQLAETTGKKNTFMEKYATQQERQEFIKAAALEQKRLKSLEEYLKEN